jgi:hypothetical protein
MKVARIIPRLADLPRCSAMRITVYANDTTSKNRCRLKAKVMYDGTALCMRHAEMQALIDVLKGDK